METLCRSIPKAELHLHIEGTLEPEMAVQLAEENGIKVCSAEEMRKKYNFSSLSDFLDLYYANCNVLRHRDNFRLLTEAYLNAFKGEGGAHTEVFFDPQTHMANGVKLAEVVEGIVAGLRWGEEELGISWRLIMCFIRDRPVSEALNVLEEAAPFYHTHIHAIGLDSCEMGYPPSLFSEVFERARTQYGLQCVAHACEEGPPSYGWEALRCLQAQRIDHGVKILEDAALYDHVRERGVPLTVCPLSNVALKVVDDLQRHNMFKMIREGVRVTINSDDPAYFGGYIGTNYVLAQKAGSLTAEQIASVAKNSFRASFIPEEEKERMCALVDRHLAEWKEAEGVVGV